MLMETIIASFLLICLGLFFAVNLHNILVTHRTEDAVTPHAEIDRPSGISVSMATLGTLVYFIEAILHPLLVLANLVSLLSPFAFGLQPTFTPYARILGLLLTTFGYFLFLWSVVARGQYATSWAMRDKHKLVTLGPYRYVRHPSYLAYFSMFIGLLAIWPSWLTLIPLIAIPGYFRVTFQEEKLLEQRFGREYMKYQKKTGRFIPKLWQRIRNQESQSR
jgi:protein-S-isoprenylcysteine O-methyltransferase Ste14